MRLLVLSCVVLLSLVFEARGDCKKEEYLALREEYQSAVRIAANIGSDCARHQCVGDQYIAENPLLSAAGRRLGTMDSVCTVLPQLDRASCRWTMYVTASDSEIQVSGVSYGHVENETEVIVLGGTGKYLGITGSGTSFVPASATERWFQLYLCYPNDGAGSGCRYTELDFSENPEQISDVLVPAVPGYFSSGAIDLFSNQLQVDDNVFGIVDGYDDGQCMYLNRRWLCQWNQRLPDEDNKIFTQGSIATVKDQPEIVPVIGGTGKFMNARGNATVTARQAPNQNAYYWETKLKIKYNCDLFPKKQRISFRSYVGQSLVVPSRAAPNQNPPNPGDVRVFIDDLRSMPNAERSEPVDGTAAGTCVESNDDDRHYCEWIMQYPLGGVPNGKGSSQIMVIGTIVDNPNVVSTIAVVGGTGLWDGAHGYGSYQPASSHIDDSDQGSMIASFFLEFSYY